MISHKLNSTTKKFWLIIVPFFSSIFLITISIFVVLFVYIMDFFAEFSEKVWKEYGLMELLYVGILALTILVCIKLFTPVYKKALVSPEKMNRLGLFAIWLVGIFLWAMLLIIIYFTFGAYYLFKYGT